uniref:Uncharacterized protein n=2 Tax=Gossypium raimondii TaxID=29730 RepID=A0A0D2V8E7_GOSRA|nr:hypothetical protein B456_013G026800 [Gossypium raimondii]
MQSMMEAVADAGKASIQEKVKKSREPTEKEMGRERKEETLNQKATAWQAGFAAGGLDGGDVNREKTGDSDGRVLGSCLMKEYSHTKCFSCESHGCGLGFSICGGLEIFSDRTRRGFKNCHDKALLQITRGNCI